MLRWVRLLVLIAALAFAPPADAGLLKWLFKPTVRAAADIALRLPTTRVTARPPVHILVPQDDAGYLRMFGRTRTGLMAEEMQSANDVLVGIDSRFVSSMEDLHLALASSDSNAVYLVAHSDDRGKSIAIPGGARVEMQLLEDQCSEIGKVCIVISCHSPHLGLTREIEYKHAVMAAAESARAWTDTPADAVKRSRKSSTSGTRTQDSGISEAPVTVEELAKFAADQLNKLSRGGTRRASPFKARAVGSSIVIVSALVAGKASDPRN